MTTMPEDCVPDFMRKALHRRSVLQAIPLLLAGPAFAQPAVSGAEPLQAWLDARAGQRGPVVLGPVPTPTSIDGRIRVPDGMDLIVRRHLRGTPRALLEVGGSSSITFDGVTSENVPIRITGGSVRITGLDYRGNFHLAAILLDGAGPYRNIVIDNIAVADANFGILRQGDRSSLTGATIRNARFRRLRGDAIEWNVCPRDTGVLVDGIDIQGIHNDQGKPNWGIGVGFAGARYTPDWDRAQAVKNFRIRNVTGRSLVQLIHAEAATDFVVEGIRGTDLSSRYSPSAGLHAALLAVYGCSDFVLRDMASDSGDMLIFAGVQRSAYVVPSANFTLDGIRLARGDIRTEMGGRNSRASLRHVTLAAGRLVLSGSVAVLDMQDVSVTSPSRAVEPMVRRPDFLSGPLQRFRPAAPRETRVRTRLVRG